MQVYAYTNTTVRYKSPFAAWNEWPQSRSGDSHPNFLGSTMDMLLAHNAAAKKSYAEIAAQTNVVNENHSKRNIAGLISLMETGERTEAQQPEGLQVRAAAAAATVPGIAILEF